MGSPSAGTHTRSGPDDALDTPACSTPTPRRASSSTTGTRRRARIGWTSRPRAWPPRCRQACGSRRSEGPSPRGPGPAREHRPEATDRPGRRPARTCALRVPGDHLAGESRRSQPQGKLGRPTPPHGGALDRARRRHELRRSRLPGTRSRLERRASNEPRSFSCIRDTGHRRDVGLSANDGSRSCNPAGFEPTADRSSDEPGTPPATSAVHASERTTRDKRNTGLDHHRSTRLDRSSEHATGFDSDAEAKLKIRLSPLFRAHRRGTSPRTVVGMTSRPVAPTGCPRA